MGIEFKENSYNLNAKCSKTMKTDMILSLNLGFENIPDPKDSKKEKSYALMLADTVIVGQDKSRLLSDGMKVETDVIFLLENDEKESKRNKQNGDRKSGANGRRAGASRTQAAVVKSKLRQKDTGHAEGLERRRQHQLELAAKKHQEGLEKYEEGGGGSLVKEKQWKRFESYQRENQIPSEATSLEVRVSSSFELICK